MPVYRNDPRMLTRKIDPATGETLTTYSPPQINPVLEPRVALSPRAAELHRANNMPVPPVVNPNYDWEVARAEASRTGGNAHEILREIEARPALLAKLQAETGNLESEAAVRRASLEPLELPGVGKVDPRSAPFIDQRAREAASLREAQESPFTLGTGQRKFRGSGELIAEGREPELTPYQQEQLRLANERLGQSGSWRTTVDENGNPVQRWMPRGTGGDIPVGPTADMRNKAVQRERIGPFITDLKALSERVINKPLSIEQKAEAAIRGIDAALANDPDYRTYQDMRTSLAASIGVMEQGARISDADVFSVYLPMIPDVYKDTADSRAMKWKLIENRVGAGGSQATSHGGEPKRPAGVPADARWDAKARQWVKD